MKESIRGKKRNSSSARAGPEKEIEKVRIHSLINKINALGKIVRIESFTPRGKLKKQHIGLILIPSHSPSNSHFKIVESTKTQRVKISSRTRVTPLRALIEENTERQFLPATSRGKLTLQLSMIQRIIEVDNEILQRILGTLEEFWR